MASVDEAYLDMTGTERLHGRPLQCRAASACLDEVEYAFELLDRNRHLAPDCESILAKAKPNGVFWVFQEEKPNSSRRSRSATFPV